MSLVNTTTGKAGEEKEGSTAKMWTTRCQPSIPTQSIVHVVTKSYRYLVGCALYAVGIFLCQCRITTDIFDRIAPYVFFCARCERTNASVTNWAAFHHSKKDHQILRIYDTVEVKAFRGSEGHSVGVQLEEINTTISSLEKKINKQLQEGKETKGVVDEMAKKVGISWSDEYSVSQGYEEMAEVSSYKPMTASDSVQQSGTFIPIDAEGIPTQHSEPLNTYETGNGVNESELAQRLDMLEAKIGAKVDSSEPPKDKDIGVKIDALEAKMDALFILVQRLVSFVLISFIIGAGLIFYNSL